MTIPKLRHSHIGENGELISREVCIDTENTRSLDKIFPISKVLLRRYELSHTFESIEHEDLAARMLWYSRESGRIVAVNYHNFLGDIYDDLNESFVSERKHILRNMEPEHTVVTQVKSALRHIFFGRSSLHPPAREERESVVSALVALAKVNPSVIEGEVTNMIGAGYFAKIEVNQTEYVEPTVKLLKRIFEEQKK